jgi:hypothetical protein
MMVKLGKVMGLEDADAIASITDKDVEHFFSARVVKGEEEAYWKKVFLTDEKGNFLKQDGEIVRNKDFRPVSYLEYSAAHYKTTNMTGYSATGEFAYQQSTEITKLSGVRPEALLGLAAAVESGSLPTVFRAMAMVSGSSKGDIWSEGNEKSILDPNASVKKALRRDKIEFYAYIFNLLRKESIHTVDKYA